MKAIKLNAIITGIRAKVDGSLGLSISTPELSSDEKVEIINLQNQSLEMFLKMADVAPEGIIKIDKEVEIKSQSQRIYSIIYLIWKQNGSKGDFKDYYYRQTERLIEKLKTLLN